jgi:hypothetical protein
MRRTLAAAGVAVLAAGVGLVVPAWASAVPSNVVTSSEFFRVAEGNSIGFVRSVFGSDGTVTERRDLSGTTQDLLVVEFPTAAADGVVQVEFARRVSGAWYLVDKYADWRNDPARTTDKATEQEFYRVKQGNTVAYARKTFGANGTVTRYRDALGFDLDRVSVAWPTASGRGSVELQFVKNSSGDWRVATRTAYWDVPPRQTVDKATEPEFYRVASGNSLDYARRTFGTAGTVNAYEDLGGTVQDALTVEWPTASPYGAVSVDFVRNTAGVWKVDARRAFWSDPAEPTADLATEAELESIVVAVERGDVVTLVRVRETFGTAGSVIAYDDRPGTAADVLEVTWFTGARFGDVRLTFDKSRAAAWAVTSAAHVISPWSGASSG